MFGGEHQKLSHFQVRPKSTLHLEPSTLNQEGIRKLIRFLGRPETDAEIEAALYDLDPSGEIDYA